MTTQPSQPGAGPDGAAPTPKTPIPQPNLRCPFCSGTRFDFGRDIYAGPDQILYCRKSPPPGHRPDPELSLPMKGAVCLDCGYVAMMVSIEQLRAPIHKVAPPAGAAGQDPTIQALEEMTRAAGTARAEQQASQALETSRDEPNGFGDLDALLDAAERARQGKPNEEVP